MHNFFKATRNRSKTGSEASANGSNIDQSHNEASRAPSQNSIPGPVPQGGFEQTSYSSMNGSSNLWSDSAGFSSPLADFHHAIPGMRPEVKAAMTANFIHGKQEEKLWTTGAKGEGVFLRKSRGAYITCPETLKTDGSLTYNAIHQLNVQVCPYSVTILLILSYFRPP